MQIMQPKIKRHLFYADEQNRRFDKWRNSVKLVSRHTAPRESHHVEENEFIVENFAAAGEEFELECHDEPTPVAIGKTIATLPYLRMPQLLFRQIRLPNLNPMRLWKSWLNSSGRPTKPQRTVQLSSTKCITAARWAL
jgi:hypothetical protein